MCGLSVPGSASVVQGLLQWLLHCLWLVPVLLVGYATGVWFLPHQVAGVVVTSLGLLCPGRCNLSPLTLLAMHGVMLYLHVVVVGG